MSGIRPVGRNGAVMELDGLFRAGERFMCEGSDFEAETVGQVVSVMGQSQGRTKVQIEFVRGGLSQAARHRISSDLRKARAATSPDGRDLPGYAGRRRKQRVKEEREINQAEHQFGSEPERDLDPEQVMIQTGGDYVQKQMALDVEIPVMPTATNVPRSGFGALIQLGISTLDGGMPAGLRGNADRGGIIDRPQNYMSNEDHVEAINRQASEGFGDTWNDEPIVPVHADNRVGVEGYYRRSDYAQERMILTTDEAADEARQALEEDGINPKHRVRGTEKYGRNSGNINQGRNRRGGRRR